MLVAVTALVVASTVAERIMPANPPPPAACVVRDVKIFCVPLELTQEVVYERRGTVTEPYLASIRVSNWFTAAVSRLGSTLIVDVTLPAAGRAAWAERANVSAADRTVTCETICIVFMNVFPGLEVVETTGEQRGWATSGSEHRVQSRLAHGKRIPAAGSRPDQPGLDCATSSLDTNGRLAFSAAVTIHTSHAGLGDHQIHAKTSCSDNGMISNRS